MEGGADGTKIKKLTSSCTWLVKATCGALGMAFDTTNTNFVDADFNLHVVEYTKEFSTENSVTLETGGWMPADKPNALTFNKFLEYYDDTQWVFKLNGELPSITITDASFSRVVPGSFIKNWLGFIDTERKAYATQVAAYEADIAKFTADKNNKNRPGYLPKTPSTYSGPVVTKELLFQGLGKTVGDLVTINKKGKSFGV